MMEYILGNMWQIWAIVAIFCLILELLNGDFFIVCFSIGAVFSALSVLIGIPPMWQLLVFAVFSVIGLLFVRPWAKKYILTQKESRVSNADAIIGRIGRVSETIIAGGYGRVSIDGDDWKAKSIDDSVINVGERVKITARESIIVTVEKI